MTGPDGTATSEDQRLAVTAAMAAVADLVADGAELVLTHGNGPQVGNLLVKNELAAHLVPPMPLDWCVAQTQATIGMLMLNALDLALAERRAVPRPAVVVTRTLVGRDDPGFAHPTKPIGRYLPEPQARRLAAHGEVWESRGQRGWRRMVASPEPLEIMDAPAVRTLLDAGFVVVCAGGGGVPVVRGADGELRGVPAVIDKDLAAAVLARAVGAELLVIATDVDQAVRDFGTPSATPIGRVTPSELRAIAAEGHFASGSMGPKVEATIRFVEEGGHRAAITSLERIGAAARGEAGTVVQRS